MSWHFEGKVDARGTGKGVYNQLARKNKMI
jgi:hypothetical protein